MGIAYDAHDSLSGWMPHYDAAIRVTHQHLAHVRETHAQQILGLVVLLQATSLEERRTEKALQQTNLEGSNLLGEHIAFNVPEVNVTPAYGDECELVHWMELDGEHRITR